MGREKERQKYIHNFARTLQGRMRVEPSVFQDCADAIAVAKALAMLRSPEIFQFVGGLSDEIKGRLACAGIGTLTPPDYRQKYVAVDSSNDYLHSWLDPFRSGAWMVQMLAASAVIAAMADNIWAELQKAKIEIQPEKKSGILKCRFCKWKTVWSARRGGQDASFMALWDHIFHEHRDKSDEILKYAYESVDEGKDAHLAELIEQD